MANVTQWLTDLKRPLNKGQGHSFWYQSIPYMRLPIVNSNFCSRIHRLATIYALQTTEHNTGISATAS